jgi:hypothetical protein
MTAPAANTVARAAAAFDPAVAPQAPRPGTSTWVAFYVAAPLIMALPLGWYGAGIGAEWPRTTSMLLWGSVCLLSWILSDLLARLLARLPGASRAPAWVLLVGGYLLNLLASSLYNPAIVKGLVHFGLALETPAVTDYFNVERSLLDPGYLWLLLAAGIPGLFVWLAGNYALERIAGVPRLRRSALRFGPAEPIGAVASAADRTPAPAAQTAPPLPRFFLRLARLTDLRTEELVAIEAEDHYIQVHSTRGKELVYYRFKDALEDLRDLDGLQIHRSAWVSRNGISALEEEGRALQVVLVTGARMRASLSNRGALLQAGFRPRHG